MSIWGEGSPGSRHSPCKGPGAERSVTCRGNSQETRVRWMLADSSHCQHVGEGACSLFRVHPLKTLPGLLRAPEIKSPVLPLAPKALLDLPVPSLPSAPPSGHTAPACFSGHTWHGPASGPLHELCPLPGGPFPFTPSPGEPRLVFQTVAASSVYSLWGERREGVQERPASSREQPDRDREEGAGHGTRVGVGGQLLCGPPPLPMPSYPSSTLTREAGNIFSLG